MIHGKVSFVTGKIEGIICYTKNIVYKKKTGNVSNDTLYNMYIDVAYINIYYFIVTNYTYFLTCIIRYITMYRQINL